jgi:hypothetical protein
MEESQVIGIFVAGFGLLCGFGLLIVKVDKKDTDRASIITPWASFYRFHWFRLVISLLCFTLSLLSLGWAFGLHS